MRCLIWLIVEGNTDKPFGKEEEDVEHRLRVKTKRPQVERLVHVRKMRLSERIFNRLFGMSQQVTIIVPGETITTLEIEEEMDSESNERVARNKRDFNSSVE